LLRNLFLAGGFVSKEDMRVTVLNATFNNIPVNIVAVSFIGGENHRPVASH
jgi:hypothetical protein